MLASTAAPLHSFQPRADAQSYIRDTHLGLEIFVLEQQFAGPTDGGRDLLLEYLEWIDGGRDALGSGLQGCFAAQLGLASTHALHVCVNTRAGVTRSFTHSFTHARLHPPE